MYTIKLTRISDGQVVETKKCTCKTYVEKLEDELNLYKCIHEDPEKLYREVQEYRKLVNFLKENHVVDKLSNLIERYSLDEF